VKVVITGGCGFIGVVLARRLLQRGTLTGPTGQPEPIDSMVLFDAVVPEERPPGLDDRVALMAGDVSDRDTVFGLVDRDDVSVFHFASVVSAGGELDFDLALRVNLDGGRNVLEASRARAGTPRVLFLSSVATFGGSAMPSAVSDTTKQTPRTTYGMTKVIGELMINDYTRKGFIDGRSARLPTIVIRPGQPNAAASGFASGIFREPLGGEEYVLPVTSETRIAVLGIRNCVEGLIALHQADGGAIGDDRALNLPNISASVTDMIDALTRVAAEDGRTLGPITPRPDPAVQAIIDGWPIALEADRALALGLPRAESLDHIIREYIEDYLDA
jgi:nucleoside-diphosphate-sugar epimerase